MIYEKWILFFRSMYLLVFMGFLLHLWKKYVIIINMRESIRQVGTLLGGLGTGMFCVEEGSGAISNEY